MTALLLMAPLRVEVTGCEPHFDLAALERQLKLEWPDPPDGAEVNLRCAEAGAWDLTLRATGKQPRSEPLALPVLSAESRGRVLALIISERGRALSTEPATAVQPLEAAPRPPLISTPLPPLPTPGLTASAEASPLRASVFTARLAEEPLHPWRVGLGATCLTSLGLGPLRLGPQLRLQRGFFGLSIEGTFGSRTLPTGTVLPATFTVEPEVTVGCVTARWWQLCAGARGIIGYGVIRATSTDPNVTIGQVDGPMLGGGAQLGASLRLNGWLALDFDGRMGGTWAVVATGDGQPIAALGGAFAGGQLSLTASWQSP